MYLYEILLCVLSYLFLLGTQYIILNILIIYLGWIWWKVQYTKNDFFGVFFIKNDLPRIDLIGKIVFNFLSDL